MISSIEKKPIPYVLEDDRSNPPNEQTIFMVTPKTHKESNISVSRYAGASRDARGGYRDFNVSKLNDADVQEFVSLISRIIRFQLRESDNIYYGRFKNGIIESTTDKEVIAYIASVISTAHQSEIFDAAADVKKLESGRFIGKVPPESIDNK